MDVSVIIPVYNAERYLQQAVESVLAERSRGVKEIIIVEDGSPDDSFKVAQRLENEYPLIIKLYRHPGGINKGAGASRNLGVNKASGDLICFLDADDYWLPGRLNEGVKLLASNPEIDGVYDGATYLFETEEERQRFKNFPEINGTTKEIEPENLFREALREKHIFCTNGILLRKDCFERIGYYNEDLRKSQDTEIFFRMCLSLRLIGSPSKKPVAVIRRHGENRWNPENRSTEEQIQIECAVYESLNQWFKDNPVNQENKILLLRRLMFLMGCLGRFKDAWKIARAHHRATLILYMWRHRFPGPRTIFRLSHFIWLRLKNRLFCY